MAKMDDRGLHGKYDRYVHIAATRQRKGRDGMRHAVTTVRLRLRVPAYRILYAMGGVEVLAVEDLPEPAPAEGEGTSAVQDFLAVTLRLSGSMLAFALELAGPELSENAEATEEPAAE